MQMPCKLNLEAKTTCWYNEKNVIRKLNSTALLGTEQVQWMAFLFIVLSCSAEHRLQAPHHPGRGSAALLVPELIPREGDCRAASGGCAQQHGCRSRGTGVQSQMATFMDK